MFGSLGFDMECAPGWLAWTLQGVLMAVENGCPCHYRGFGKSVRGNSCMLSYGDHLSKDEVKDTFRK